MAAMKAAKAAGRRSTRGRPAACARGSRAGCGRTACARSRCGLRRPRRPSRRSSAADAFKAKMAAMKAAKAARCCGSRGSGTSARTARCGSRARGGSPPRARPMPEAGARAARGRARAGRVARTRSGRGARGTVGPARDRARAGAVPAGPARRAPRGNDGAPDPTRGEGHRARGMRVGIDLGTTYSLVARMDAEGRPALVPDCAESDVFHTPSVVHIAQNAAFVGRMAEQLLEQDPTIQVIRFFKRLMGVPEPVCYDDNGAAWYPEGVSALLLKKLAFDVESMAQPAAGRGGHHGARALQRPAAQGRPGRGDAGRHRGAWVWWRSRWLPRCTTAWWAACTTRCCSSTTSAAAPSTRPR